MQMRWLAACLGVLLLASAARAGADDGMNGGSPGGGKAVPASRFDGATPTGSSDTVSTRPITHMDAPEAKAPGCAARHSESARIAKARGSSPE